MPKRKIEFSYARREIFSKGAFLTTGALLGVGISRMMGAAEPPKIPTRQSIETISQSDLGKIEGAIQEMMDRSQKNAKDPRGWLANAEPHRTFCALAGVGPSQIHGCYWFLPWHRAYIAITERKIREIAKDPSLALPYWNWSVNRRIPNRFSRKQSALSKAVRFTPNRDLRNSEIDLLIDDPVLSQLGVAALNARKFVATAQKEDFDLAMELRQSFGGVARPNKFDKYGGSRFELTPHGPVHVYVGGENPTTGEPGDMSDFATAGRDPIFFAHHGNLDRLWEKWRSMGKNKATEPNDDLFLKNKFVFPWLDGSSVEVLVSETMDTKTLGYQYDTLDVLGAAVKPMATNPEAATTVLPPILNAPLTIPATPESAEKRRYILIIDGLQFPARNLSAGVYVSLRGKLNSGARILVGSISVVRSGQNYVFPSTVQIFDVTEAIAALGRAEIEVIVVPNAIGGEKRLPYQSIPYKSARISVQ